MNLGTKYVVLRTHARINDLLSVEQMKNLADAPNVQEFLLRLKDTSYGEIQVEEDDKIALNLEKNFIKKFIERIEEIVKITPSKMGEFLHAYFDFRFEVLNLKRILRGKFTDSSSEEIVESLIPIDPYIIKDYGELISSNDLESLVRKLSGTSYESLIGKLDLYKEYDALWPLELELNYIYARNILRLTEKLSAKDRHIVNSLVKYETDVENVLIAIKRRGKEGINLDEIFPVTYGIDKADLKKIIEAENLSKAIDELKEPYNQVLAPIKTGDIALVRAMLRKGKYETATAARAGDQFGFNVILGLTFLPYFYILFLMNHSIESVYFDGKGKDYTEETLKLAKKRADELGIKNIIIASYTGYAGVLASEVFKGYNLVVSAGMMGFTEPNVHRMVDGNRDKMEANGAKVFYHLHAFGGLGRSVKQRFGPIQVDEIIASVLRVFSQGVKVCLEISCMACDAGLIKAGEPVVAIGGSGGGADSSIVLLPSNTHRFFDTKVLEVICKPRVG